MSLITFYQSFNDRLQVANGVPMLLLRIYLAPVLIQAGWNKVSHFDDIVAWFGNPEWGLGLPMPEVMAVMAIGAELIGGILILLGLFTRLISVPLMVTMIVAMATVHWQHGWLAIADSSSWLADGTLYYDESVMAAAEKLERANSILQQHGHYDWLTESGKFVILNNGIEFAATYLLMLLVLFFYGGGRYVSCDHWLHHYGGKSKG